MTYKLKFLPSVKREWETLDHSIKVQFKSKLQKCLENPHVVARPLPGFASAYHIKLRSAGYRLVYEVDDQPVVVMVIAVGKREKLATYRSSASALTREQPPAPELYPSAG